MSKPLIVKYQGKKSEINLVIEDCPDDIEIRTKLQDDSYQADWKREYLDSHYEESLNNQRETRKDRHTALETFTHEDEKYFSSKDDPQRAFEEKRIVDSLLAHCNENQREILKLHYMEGYSKTDIAKMRGVDESAIRRTITRAIKTIKRNLK